ncbi:hypothetical protein [Emticicia sp. 17c]|uniref:hypothetical protein n=1 Tax=Emticicia sp. 17c TaxID=3127704 RepID=UPI00301E598D
MKKTKGLLVLIAFISVIQVSLGQTSFTEQKAGHIYTLSVPNYMAKTFTLNDVASMQYHNAAKNAYLVVIDDTKEELEMKGIKFGSLKEFHDENIKQLSAEENMPTESGQTEFTINGNKFYQSQLSVTLKEEGSADVKITYLVTYVETKDYYYQVLCWSLTSDFKSLLGDFKKIAASLKD